MTEVISYYNKKHSNIYFNFWKGVSRINVDRTNMHST
jgi:hypothetical protein